MKEKQLSALTDLLFKIEVKAISLKHKENLALLPYTDVFILRDIEAEKKELQALKMAYNENINNLTKY